MTLNGGSKAQLYEIAYARECQALEAVHPELLQTPPAPESPEYPAWMDWMIAMYDEAGIRATLLVYGDM